MRRIAKYLKKNYKLFIGMIIGGVVFGGIGVYAATVISAYSISYIDNDDLGATNVQDAIDKLNEKIDIRKRGNFISAYKYNESTCVTGEEDTCVKTDCYKEKTVGSCSAGTIIKYKVNDTDIVTFHVMFDNGSTLTMQSQKNTLNNTQWISKEDYATKNTDGTSCSYDSCNDEGPMTVLMALERVTNSWSNVNDQTYTVGTTIFKSNAFSGCSSYNLCTKNVYTLPSRIVKARMITAQEATSLGCTDNSKSCPNWMYNYLYNSINYGGTVSDDSKDVSTEKYNNGYWTMSADSSNAGYSWYIVYRGNMQSNNTSISNNYVGARAVIVISK